MNTKANYDRPCIEEVLCAKEDSERKKIYLRSEKTFVEVSDEVYREYYRPIWKALKQAQRKGECACPKEARWQCDGECHTCEYRVVSSADVLSDTMVIHDDSVLTIADTLTSNEASPESVALFHDLQSTLEKEICQMSQLEQKIAYLYLNGMTEREIAPVVDRSPSKVNKHKQRIIKTLKNALQEYEI